MKIAAVTLLSFSIVLLVATNAFAADRVKAGQWETTLTGPSAKPMVTKYCITAADAQLMNGDLATLRKYVTESMTRNTKGRCSVRNVELKDNRTIVTVVCGKSEVVGTTTYHGDRYESTSSNGTTVAG